MANRESKLHQVRALFNMTVANGCTEEEAKNAFLKAQQIMSTWQLALSDCDIITNEKEPILPMQSSIVVKNDLWVGILAQAIANNFRVRHWVNRVEVVCDQKKTRGKQGEPIYKKYTFFGEQSDAELAVYLFEQSIRTARSLAEEHINDTVFLAGDNKTFRKLALAYLEGFAVGIKEAFEQQVAADRLLNSGNTSLMVLSQVPARVEREYAKIPMGRGYGWGQSHASASGTAFSAGHKDGSSFGAQARETKGARNTTKRLGS